MWVLVVVLLVALMIPITAILLDSPLGRSFARRLDGQGDGGGAGSGAGVRKLEQRVEALETDLEDLNRSIAGMREELQFVQRLLEDPGKKKRPTCPRQSRSPAGVVGEVAMRRRSPPASS